MLKPCSLLLSILCLATPQAQARPKTVVVISVDGLRPDYVTEAEKRGLVVPHLRRFITDGAYAEGVIGVVPTVTYPSHTTLMTGVWPSQHGIVANTTFDPLHHNLDGWYRFASEIKVPTLWQTAGDAGIVVASVGWPVTVGAQGVTYLIPELWGEQTDEDRLLMESLSRPTGWLQKMEQQLGPYRSDSDGIGNDEMRTRFSVAILKEKKPGFMMIHLGAMDHAQHATGPFSDESNRILVEMDKLIGEIEDAAKSVGPDAVVVIVSDHGFVRTDYRVNLMLPFLEAGLVKTGAGNRGASVVSWDAMLWPDGGSAAVVLRDPEDVATRQKVADLLKKLQADPTYGINRVLTQPEIEKIGGFPTAAFLIEMKQDYQVKSAFSGPLIEKVPSTGMHGYLPDNPELRSSFFIEGEGIAHGKNLGVIDMRQIAPTLATLLGVKLPVAQAPLLIGK
ncbi:alkaline phosphatase family protein [Granulicella sp. WH15]|uniref:alkaline phosphatase family protein n=1 Tax=Granulicella sp. WH15 TaxID=2602070 RepID=UPI0013669137|nr:ectonucleotide pyrophosphatase/phosphodiesterase [Granulicella sp. WH15]QHN02893.1 alkaline phosphatase family protein [Granulicella sp. WH15]